MEPMSGAEMRKLRKLMGASQAELGERLGYGKDRIGELERSDRVEPRVAEFVRLAIGRRVTTGKFGERFVTVITEPAKGGRSHTVSDAYDTEAEAIAAAKSFAVARPEFKYIAQPH